MAFGEVGLPGFCSVAPLPPLPPLPLPPLSVVGIATAWITAVPPGFTGTPSTHQTPLLTFVTAIPLTQILWSFTLMVPLTVIRGWFMSTLVKSSSTSRTVLWTTERFVALVLPAASVIVRVNVFAPGPKG